MDQLDRAKGCLAGLAIGDALGRPVEGFSINEIESQFGEITEFIDDDIQGTDDTEFAILTASTLLEFGLAATSVDFAHSWRVRVLPQSEALVGAGFSELSTVRNLRLGLMPPVSGMHSASWSDGLAMRIAPIGIAASHDYALVVRLAKSDGAVSNAGEGIWGGVAVALAVSLAMNNVPTEEIFNFVKQSIPAETWLSRNLSKIEKINLERAEKTDQQLRHELIEQIAIREFPFPELAPEAVALALGSLLLAQDSFEGTLLFAVNLGRDTDTIAAICGAIVGAKVGFSNIPARWTNQLKPATGSCLKFAAGIDLVSLAPKLLGLASANE